MPDYMVVSHTEDDSSHDVFWATDMRGLLRTLVEGTQYRWGKDLDLAKLTIDRLEPGWERTSAGSERCLCKEEA